ncbi:MAG TPA: hypothetical protein VMW75_03185 [Thermoanaerobaculia bacterium]|nr:hypothetical protein [Thermoanaerobaculia bacterium]
MGISPPARSAFLNRHRVLDAILPLAQGPGLLIRSVSNGKVQWVLKVLRPEGGIASYEVPFTGALPYERLRGDARGNRIVLLAAPHDFEVKKAERPSTHVYVAEIPAPDAHQVPQEGGQR